MLRKVAGGVWWIEDADGLPAELVTVLDDGTPLSAAESWWTASARVIETLAGWAASARQGEPSGS